MTNKRVLTVSIDKDLLKDMDEKLNIVGMGSNRSGFINTALKQYLEKWQE